MLSNKRGDQFPKSSSQPPETQTPKELLSTYAEFKTWLADRQKHFDEVGAAPSDIAEFAIKQGFPEFIVKQWEAHKKWENMDGR